MAVAEGLEPSHNRINSAVPYQLGYATKNCWLRRRESNSHHLVYKTSALNPIELRRNVFGGPEGIQTLTRSLQDFYAVSYITSPKTFGGCGWIRTTNLALMRRSLFPFELHSHVNLEARGGIEPRAFPPSSSGSV